MPVEQATVSQSIAPLSFPEEKLSFDQHIARHGKPPALAAAVAAYESIVAKQPEFGTADAEAQWRREKKAAGKAMCEARTAAEASFYAGEIVEGAAHSVKQQAERKVLDSK